MKTLTNTETLRKLIWCSTGLAILAIFIFSSNVQFSLDDQTEIVSEELSVEESTFEMSPPPPPPVNESFAAGTLIIPMDNNYQNAGTAFNLKAYGLVVRLLHADIPVKWAIKSGKSKDGIDFTASTSRVAPSTSGTSNRSFRAGPFIVYPGFESQAMSVINSFNASISNKVHVYRLEQATTIEIHSTLTHKPRAALLNNGGNAAIHQDVLQEAGLSNNTHYVLGLTAADITSSSCYTFVSEAHTDEADLSNTEAANVRNFLENGGNFLAQCAAGRAYEDAGASASRLITNNGVSDPGIGGNIIFDNADDPYIQIQGGLSDEGGSAESYKTNSFKSGATVNRYAYDSNDGTNYKAYAGRVPNVTTTTGGYAHYLAGHEYVGSSIDVINGRRIYLNAFLLSATRPTGCGLNMGPVAINDEGTLTPCGQNSVTIDVLSNDSNPMGGNLTVNLLSSGSDGTFVNNNDGTVTYTPNAGYWPGTDAINYEACAGAVCSQATVTVNYSGNHVIIGGTVFNDDDQDGTQDGGEPGQNNANVNLYLDNNANGTIDAGDNLVSTQSTNINGDYQFAVNNFPTSSASTTLISTKATSNYEGGSSKGYGACSGLYIEEDNNYLSYAFIEFDLSSIPAGCNITSATLTVRKSNLEGGGDNFTVGVQRVTEQWTEGNGDCNGNNSGLTWDNRTSTNTWSTPGGSFGSTVYDTETGGDSHGNGTSYNFNVADLVNEWVNGTSPNYGLAIVPTAINAVSGYDWFTIYSDEATSSYRPRLQITYTCSQPVDYVVQIDPNSLPGTSPTITTNSAYPVSFTALGQVDCGNDFGFVSCTSAPDPGTNGYLSICAGESVSATQLFNALGGSPDGGGTWSPTSGGAGVYTYTVGGGVCPLASAQVVVTSSSVQINNIAVSNPDNCPGLNNGSIIITATGNNLQYSINGGSNYQASNTFTGLLAGNYNIRVRNSTTLCFATATRTLADIVCPEICDNGIDDDGDGLVDENDLDCGQFCPTGSLTLERWTGIGGGQVSDLTSHANYPNNPTTVDELTSFDGPDGVTDNYGTRVRGFLSPTETGNYAFNLTCDDGGELYLSPDADPNNSSLIASVNGWTGTSEHHKYSTQTSSSVYLIAGQNYYVELLHKEGGGGDHFQVFWQTPSNASWTIIPGVNLRPLNCSEICDDGMDNDGDGLIDCNDPDCSNALSVTANAASSTLCAGGSTTVSATGTGGAAPLTYTWDNGLGAGAAHTVSPASTTTYTVTVTDGNGCTATDQVTVTVNALPTASAGANQAICAGASATLMASGGVSYAWSNGLGSGANKTVSPASTATYTVTVTDSNGCTDTDQVTVSVSNVTLIVSSNNPTCPNLNNGTISLTATGSNLEYSIDGGTTFQASSFFSELTPGSYDVLVRNSSSLCFAEITGVILADYSPCNEICDNGIDDDGDGLVDCDDPECEGVTSPILVDDSFSTCPGLPFTEYVNENDGNLQDPLYSIVTQPSEGMASINAVTGKFTITPLTFECSTDQFEYQVCNQTTGCCSQATVNINYWDNTAPVLTNVPADITIDCSDIVPDPDVVFAFDLCPGIYVDIDENSTQNAAGACDSYTITRTWTATDMCGNTASEDQLITVMDVTEPEIFQVYTLENGSRVIGGVASRVSSDWKEISFPITFNAPPIVFTQVISENESSAVVAAQRYIHTQGFELRVTEEEDADGHHGREDVAWMAIETGFNAGPFTFEANSESEVTHELFQIGIGQPMGSAPLFFSSLQTNNEADPVSLRHTNLDAWDVELFAQEETSLDAETGHTPETVGYLAVAPASVIEDHKGKVFGETGTVSINHNWTTIHTNRYYEKPVVIIGGLTYNGAQPAIVRVRDVEESSFEVRIQEWDYLDGNHVLENVSWMVVEGGIPESVGNSICSGESGDLKLGENVFVVDNCDGQVGFEMNEIKSLNRGYMMTTRNWVATDNCGNTAFATQKDSCLSAGLQVKSLLRGASMNNGTGNGNLMRDDLRTQALIPITEPFTDLPQFEHLSDTLHNGHVVVNVDNDPSSGNDAPTPNPNPDTGIPDITVTTTDVCYEAGTGAQKTMVIPEGTQAVLLAEGALAGSCGNTELSGAEAAEYRTIANGKWEDGSIWEGGIAPPVDKINGKSILIQHNVVIDTSYVELGNGAELWVIEGSLTLLKKKFKIKDASARFYSSLLYLPNDKIEMDDEDAFMVMYESEVITGKDFTNKKGKRVLVNTSLNVKKYVNKDGGQDKLINVCAVISDKLDNKAAYLFASDSRFWIHKDWHNHTGTVEGDHLSIWIETGHMVMHDSSEWNASVDRYCIFGNNELPQSSIASATACGNLEDKFNPCRTALDATANWGGDFSPEDLTDLEGNVVLSNGDSLQAGLPGVMDSTLLEVTGEKAITDWILIELRDPVDEAEVIAYATAAVQRDGQIISEDGEETIQFGNVPEGYYYVVVHHRNHLPIMTSEPIFLSSHDPAVVDFTDPALDLYNGSNGGQYVDNTRQMWAGDFNGDGKIIYQGPYNDVFELFSRVLVDEDNVDYLANYIIYGYEREDVNLDGKVIYQGPMNDRAPVLYHSILAHPINAHFLSNFIITSYVP